MEAIFLKILNMSITGAYVILAVLLLRWLLRPAPKKYSYWLWLAVGFRLCCPASFSSGFSLFSLGPFDMRAAQSQGAAALEYVPPDIGYMTQPQVSVGLPAANAAISSALPAATPLASVNPLQLWISAGSWLWLAGVTVLLLYGVISYLRLRRRMDNAILLRDNIWQSDCLSSPFILGLCRPRIYIPFGLDAATWDYVLTHEKYHLQRRDHLIKPLAFLILAVHWFNPLAWLAFLLLGRDMEMSCDEGVLSRMDNGKKAYSTALLSFAANRRFPAPGPLAFGESGVKGRIKNVLRFKQPSKGLTLAAALLCLLGLAACALNPKTEAEEPSHTPAVIGEVTEGRVFVSSACLYMNPLSSFAGIDGDSGCRYIVEGENFDIVRRASGETEHFTGVTWDYTAFTQKEWQSWFGAITLPRPDISGYGKTIYFDLSDQYRVLNMDGELWLMQRKHSPELGDYVWSVFSLIPETPAQGALALLLEFVVSADVYAYDYTGTDWGAPTEDFASVVSRYEWLVSDSGLDWAANDPDYGLVLTNPDGRRLSCWSDMEGVVISNGIENDNLLLSCGENILEQLMPWALARQQELLDAVVPVDLNDMPGFIAGLPHFNWGQYSRAIAAQGQGYHAPIADLAEALYAYVRDNELDQGQVSCLLQGTAGLDGAYSEGYSGLLYLLMERDPYTLVWCYDRLSGSRQEAVWPFIRYAYRPADDSVAEEATVLAWMDGIRESIAAGETGLWQWQEIYGNHRQQAGVIDAPPEVLAAAETYVAEQYAYYQGAFPSWRLTQWRVESLVPYIAYELDGRKLDVYQLNYEFHSLAPQNIVLAGGRYLNQDGWCAGSGYPYCDYMLFDGESGEYLLTLMANDTYPGEETFNNDLRRSQPQLFE